MRLLTWVLLITTVIVIHSCNTVVRPEAIIEVADTTVLTGEVVSFRAKVVGAFEPDNYQWLSSTGNRGSRGLYQETFDYPGEYSIRLIVEDHWGRELRDSVRIFVSHSEADNDNGNENDNDQGDNENDNQGQDNENDNNAGNENDNDAGNENDNNDNGNENHNGNQNDNGNENENDNDNGELPDVDVKVNGLDGRLTLTDEEPVSVTVSWISSGADGCEARGSWEGMKTEDGIEVINDLGDGNYVFFLECWNDHGTASDTVLVDVRIEDDEPPDLTVEITSPDDGSTHCCVDDPIEFQIEVDDNDGEFDGPFNYHFLFPDGEVIGTSDGHSFTYSHTFPFEIQNGVVAVQVTDVPTGVISDKDWIYLSVLP